MVTTYLATQGKIIMHFFPPYSPELNPVELIWRELRINYFNNKTFETLDMVDDHLEYAINDLTKDLEAIKKLTKINYL